jgi:hypothetical protein
VVLAEDQPLCILLEFRRPLVRHSTGPREMFPRLGERTPADTAIRGWML